MLVTLLALNGLILLLVVALLLRRPSSAAAAADPRLEALLAADLSGQLARAEGRSAALSDHMREELGQVRRESAEASRALREEVLGSIQLLGRTLQEGLDTFRSDNKADAERLRVAVDAQLRQLAEDFAKFSGETAQRQMEDREALHASLRQLGREHAEQGEKLRGAVEERLNALSTLNAGKLDEMRATVDEKLQSTLNARLTESFGQVTTHLGEVQKGLGEMKELATGVGDLKKVLTNVKARGNVGEFLLAQQLEQMFSREQYGVQVQVKPNSGERVDYALKFPNGPSSTVLLPIDAKFPQDVGQKLMDSYENGSAEQITDARKAFERAIRTEAQKICDKYVDPPTTLPHAIMFLPTEGLYGEVTRVPGLLSDVQQRCRVTIAGPSTFMAILTSFQMGFHTLAIEKKGNEVWKVLGRVRGEFEKFGGLMEKVERNVGTVQNTLQEIRGKTTTINRSLKNVSRLDGDAPSPELMADNVLPLLAAEEEL
jgi:DNA recombination protein RmuC